MNKEYYISNDFRDQYSNKYIFISYALAENDIKSLNNRI